MNELVMSDDGLEGLLEVPVAPDPQVGDSVGEYRLIELLGKGGAALVFRAERSSDQKVYALKVLTAVKVKRARTVQRFINEVRAARSVKHDGLIPIIEFIDEPQPRRLAYSMPFISGEILRARLRREGAVDLRVAIQIGIQICDALRALHKVGIIHRDLKPENVLIADTVDSRMPSVKLFDFGVVKFLPEDADDGPEGLVGTPRYMAPEQAARAPIDHRADLFALGVMLFEMMTGRCPHEGDSMRDVVMAKLKGAPRIEVNPSQEILPAELTDVVDRCLRLKPSERPNNVVEVSSALRQADVVLFAVGPVRRSVEGVPVRAPPEAAPVLKELGVEEENVVPLVSEANGGGFPAGLPPLELPLPLPKPTYPWPRPTVLLLMAVLAIVLAVVARWFGMDQDAVLLGPDESIPASLDSQEFWVGTSTSAHSIDE